MRNGKWEPDPNVIQCIGVFELVTPVAIATTTLGIPIVLDIMIIQVYRKHDCLL